MATAEGDVLMEGVCFLDAAGKLRLLTTIDRQDTAARASCEGLAVAVVPRELREGGEVVPIRIVRAG
jgi:hypothetical protein